MFNHRESILVASWSPSLILWLSRCSREKSAIKVYDASDAWNEQLLHRFTPTVNHTKEIKTASPCDCGSIKARHWIFYLEDFTWNLDCTKSLVRRHIHFIEVERIKKSGVTIWKSKIWSDEFSVWFFKGLKTIRKRRLWKRIDSSNQVLFSLFRYEFSDQSLWKYGHVWNGMVQLEKNM